MTAVDSSLIWVADQGYGEVVETGVRDKSPGRFFSNREGRLPSIASICSMGNDTILFTDSSIGCIYLKVKSSAYSELNDKLALNRPTGIAVSPVTGEIVVTETGSHRIVFLDRNGNLIRTIGNRGTSPGEFNYPTHIWIDEEGKIYIVDALNFRVQVFDYSGNFLMAFGEQGDATGYFARPKGIATDSRGNIYIADALFHTIQVFDNQGRFLHYFGEQGNSDEKFWMPSGISIDKNDFLYIADSYNSRLKVYKIVHR
ncbi:MAG: 6-bladed beta-propeller [Bacteroidales bacterium]